MKRTEAAQVCAVENCANVTAVMLRVSGDGWKILELPVCAACCLRLTGEKKTAQLAQQFAR